MCLVLLVIDTIGFNYQNFAFTSSVFTFLGDLHLNLHGLQALKDIFLYKEAVCLAPILPQI